MVGRLRHRVRRLPQLQWLPRVLWSTILCRWFFLSSFCGFWVFSLSGHDCATTPAGTGKNAINFRPCFVLFFFLLFFVVVLLPIDFVQMISSDLYLCVVCISLARLLSIQEVAVYVALAFPSIFVFRLGYFEP